MGIYTSVKFRNVPPAHWPLAARILQGCAHDIKEEGVLKGTIYSVEDKFWYVYKTKTHFVIWMDP
jgi:hypothetical protein